VIPKKRKTKEAEHKGSIRKGAREKNGGRRGGVGFGSSQNPRVPG